MVEYETDSHIIQNYVLISHWFTDCLQLKVGAHTVSPGLAQLVIGSHFLALSENLRPDSTNDSRDMFIFRWPRIQKRLVCVYVQLCQLCVYREYTCQCMSTSMSFVTGSDPFNGYLQDVRIYPSSFSNRLVAATTAISRRFSRQDRYDSSFIHSPAVASFARTHQWTTLLVDKTAPPQTTPDRRRQ